MQNKTKLKINEIFLKYVYFVKTWKKIKFTDFKNILCLNFFIFMTPILGNINNRW